MSLWRKVWLQLDLLWKSSISAHYSTSPGGRGGRQREGEGRLEGGREMKAERNERGREGRKKGEKRRDGEERKRGGGIKRGGERDGGRGSE